MARRRKSTRAAATKAAPAAADKVAAAADKEDASIWPWCWLSTDAIRGADALEQFGWADLWERIVDLVMWKNVGAKSTPWFGLGSMFFFSCSFSREVTFSPIWALCDDLGLSAFFKDSIPQRQQLERGRSFRLTEEDVLRAARAVLPVANSMMKIFANAINSMMPSLVAGSKTVNQSIEDYINISTDPATFVQGTIPQIIANTKEDYFNKILHQLRNPADLCYDKIKYIRGIRSGLNVCDGKIGSVLLGWLQ